MPYRRARRNTRRTRVYRGSNYRPTAPIWTRGSVEQLPPFGPVGNEGLVNLDLTPPGSIDAGSLLGATILTAKVNLSWFTPGTLNVKDLVYVGMTVNDRGILQDPYLNSVGVDWAYWHLWNPANVHGVYAGVEVAWNSIDFEMKSKRVVSLVDDTLLLCMKFGRDSTTQAVIANRIQVAWSVLLKLS